MDRPDVDPIPEEFGSLIAQLVVRDTDRAVQFYTGTFGAKELYRQYDPAHERVVHCELLVGRSRMMLHDEFVERDLPSPETLGGTAVTLMLFVEAVDDVFAKAVAAGAQVISPPEQKFWGVRSGVVIDPFGHRWVLTSRTEDLSPGEILARAREAQDVERTPLGRTTPGE